jgi:hypothetical protein
MGSHAASYRVSGGPTAPAVLPLALSELSHLAGVTSANAVNVTFCVPTTVPVHAVKSEDGIPAETGMLNEPPIANASVSLVSTYGSDTFGSGIFGDTLGGPPLVTTLEAYLDGEFLQEPWAGAVQREHRHVSADGSDDWDVHPHWRVKGPPIVAEGARETRW